MADYEAISKRKDAELRDALAQLLNIRHEEITVRGGIVTFGVMAASTLRQTLEEYVTDPCQMCHKPTPRKDGLTCEECAAEFNTETVTKSWDEIVKELGEETPATIRVLSRVRHRKFGSGVVREILNCPAGVFAVVRFDANQRPWRVALQELEVAPNA